MQNPPSSSPQRVRVLISGRVQGVGFRYSTREAALERNIKGWVRNLPSGQVEAVFEGHSAQIESMIAWCHQGPPAAVVREVTVQPESPEDLQGFEIAR
ncbi:MAG: acylphosphatase [Cyanobacteriota bacterium]|nr:acylphosphatase [Cyanobacteriota bacterium]